MTTLQSQEGYMMLDHRNSPGVPDELVAKAGYAVGAGHGLYEEATFTCPYCESVVVKNRDRVRPRAFDKKSGHLICDACDALRSTGVEMKTMRQVVDELLNQAAKEPQSETFQPIVLGV